MASGKSLQLRNIVRPPGKFIAKHEQSGDITLIASLTGYSPTASTVGTSASKLRKVGVLDGWRISADFASAAGLA